MKQLLAKDEIAFNKLINKLVVRNNFRDFVFYVPVVTGEGYYMVQIKGSQNKWNDGFGGDIIKEKENEI